MAPAKIFKASNLEQSSCGIFESEQNFRAFVLTKQTPLIERLSGGDYNRITGITLPPSNVKEGRELILRTQRGDEGRTIRNCEVAMSQHLGEASRLEAKVKEGKQDSVIWQQTFFFVLG